MCLGNGLAPNTWQLILQTKFTDTQFCDYSLLCENTTGKWITVDDEGYLFCAQPPRLQKNPKNPKHHTQNAHNNQHATSFYRREHTAKTLSMWFFFQINLGSEFL